MSRIAQTLDLPRGDDARRPDGTAPRPFTGFVVGPLFCHHALSDDESVVMGPLGDFNFGDWNVTHIDSGLSVGKGLPTPFRAIWLAERLLELPGMEGDTAAMREAGAANIAAIHVLWVDAKNGDCQGACIGPFEENDEE